MDLELKFTEDRDILLKNYGIEQKLNNSIKVGH